MRIGLALAAVAVFVSTAAAQQTPPAKGAEYEVVSVRPTGDKTGNMMISPKLDGYSATGATVKFMIMDAYGLKNQDLISGLPRWASDDRFDVQARMDAEMIEAQKRLTPKERYSAHRAMVQALLADRFQLKVHMDEKEMPAYALVQSKGGFKLKKPESEDFEKSGAKLPDGTRGGMLMYRHDSITGQMVSIDALAQNLGMNLHRRVIDRSGIIGAYDFTLKFAPEDAPTGGVEAAPSLFTALEEQLGLKLESIRAKIETVVVDRVEHPTAN